mmetsp:Transcript_10738/g.16202  ORF Transcript_10738/g.16202 Transcript_10738/m.16202 type:complete len:363 (-) Transcript_10738:13-1101(-)
MEIKVKVLFLLECILLIGRGYELDKEKKPISKNATISMQIAKEMWFRKGSKSTVEFVHIHKCSGMSVEVLAPRILFGNESICSQNMTAFFIQNKTWPICLTRPIDMTDRKSMSTLITKVQPKIRYVSSRFEVGAYELLPWHPKKIIKIIFVREPWQRYKSDQGFSCSKYGRHWLHHSRDAHIQSPHVQRRYFRPVIEDHLLPESERYNKNSNKQQEISRQQLATLRIQAFGFIGVVEHFAESSCLFAYTFAGLNYLDFTLDAPLRNRLICSFCCSHPKQQNTIPHLNAHDYRNPACSFHYTQEDKDLYLKLHKHDDVFAYHTAARIFNERYNFFLLFQKNSSNIIKKNICPNCPIFSSSTKV